MKLKTQFWKSENYTAEIQIVFLRILVSFQIRFAEKDNDTLNVLFNGRITARDLKNVMTW